MKLTITYHIHVVLHEPSVLINLAGTGMIKLLLLYTQFPCYNVIPAQSNDTL